MMPPRRRALGHLFAFFLGASSSLGALFGSAYSSLDGWFSYMVIALVVMIDSAVISVYLLRPFRGEKGFRSYKGRFLATCALTFVLVALLSYLFLSGTVLYAEKEVLPYFLSYIIFGGLAFLACLFAPGFAWGRSDEEEGVERVAKEH